MRCASCVARVERALRRLPQVTEASVNLATQRAHATVLQGAASTEALVAAVRRAGYEAAPVEVVALPAEAARAAARNRRELAHVVAAAALSAPLVAGTAAHLVGARWMVPGWGQFALATIVQFWLVWRFYVAGWKAARALSGTTWTCWRRSAPPPPWGLSVHELLIAAPGHQPTLYFESSALLITFILFGKWLEARAKRQTASAIRALMGLCPDTASVRRNGVERAVPLPQVAAGDVVVVRPGERIPIDGRVIEGGGQGKPAVASLRFSQAARARSWR
ncbi:MAG: cation transporter [Acetobacteraceae bacterium]